MPKYSKSGRLIKTLTKSVIKDYMERLRANRKHVKGQKYKRNR